jgi:hypothetical protein
MYKKNMKIYFLILLIFIKMSLFGSDYFDIYDIFDRIGLNILPISYDFNYSNENGYTNEISIGLIVWNMENSKTGIGFEIIPLKYNCVFNNHVFISINFSIHWNILDIFYNEWEKSLFGPFASIDYPIYLDGHFSTSDYIYKMGFKYTFRRFFVHDPFIPPIISIETGYKYIFGNKNNYFSVQIGLFSPLYAFFNYKINQLYN